MHCIKGMRKSRLNNDLINSATSQLDLYRNTTLLYLDVKISSKFHLEFARLLQTRERVFTDMDPVG